MDEDQPTTELKMNKVEAAPYGIKAVRQIKESSSGKPQKSLRQQKKVNDTYNYFLEKVDPVIGACITQLLIDQPDPSSVPDHMIDFLTRAGPDLKIEAVPGQQQQRNNSRPRKEMKLYLATSIAPIVTKLVNRIALEQPEDVRDYMKKELRNLLSGVADKELPQTPVDMTKASMHGAPVGSKNQQRSPRAVNEVSKVEQDQQHAVSTATATATSVQKVDITVRPPSAPASATPQQQQQTQPLQEKSIQIALLGLGGVGKSSLINQLQGKFDKPRPTIGFRPVSMMLSEETKVRFYDLGGGKKIRDIWAQYYHDVHGVVFVVDGSVKRDEMQETAEVLGKCFSNSSFLANKPLLIVANKQDAADAVTIEEWRDFLQASALTNFPSPQIVLYSSACAAVPAEDAVAPEADPRIEAAIEQLLEQVIGHFDELNDRVIADTKQKTIEEARRRIERERNVLRKKIASAFLDTADPAYIAEHQIEAEPDRIFTAEEGVAFIAAEIGEEVANLPQTAVEIAAMVGYHQLAMQIVGGLKAPVSKKKTPLEWSEIHTMVKELRVELQLQ